DTRPHCTCEGFKNDECCKHWIAVRKADEAAEEAALCVQAEEPFWMQKAEDDFRLLLEEGEEGWQYVDAIGRVRMQSPMREVLESNAAEVKAALQQSAEMASRCAEVGILLRGQARWNV